MKNTIVIALLFLSSSIFADSEHVTYFGVTTSVRSIPCSIDRKITPYVIKQYGVLMGLRFNDKLGIELDAFTGQSKAKENVYFSTKTKIHGLAVNVHHYIPVTSNLEMIVGIGTASLTHIIRDCFAVDDYERHERSRLIPRGQFGFQYFFNNTLGLRFLGTIEDVSKLKHTMFILENEKIQKSVIHRPKKSFSVQTGLLFRFP